MGIYGNFFRYIDVHVIDNCRGCIDGPYLEKQTTVNDSERVSRFIDAGSLWSVYRLYCK